MKNMFVDGNAESIRFNQDSKGVYTDMNQTVSARIKILFKEKEIERIVTIREPEGVRTPVPELKEDVFLTGFTWRPEQRPLSKKEVINGKPKAKPAAKKAAPGTAATKTTSKTGSTKDKAPIKNVAAPKKDSTAIETILPKAGNLLKLLPKNDSLKADTLKPKPVPLKK
ncbi:hypothetical protein D3C87_1349220 [compost metagenome]